MTLEHKLDLIKPRLQKSEEDVAILKAEIPNALKNLTHRHKTETSDQATALQQAVVVLKGACYLEKNEGRRLSEIVKRKQQNALT